MSRGVVVFVLVCLSAIAFVLGGTASCESVPDPTFVDVDGGVAAGEGGPGPDAKADAPPPPPPQSCPTSAPSGTICCGKVPCVGCASSDCAGCTAQGCNTDQVCCKKPGNAGGFVCKPLSACH